MMKTLSQWTFLGGIHLPEEKEQTHALPIQPLPLPEKVVIPLSQHTGAICEPVVKTGEVVKTGQKIGEAKAFIASPIHASLSGKVTDISPQPHPLGTDVLSITIQSDGKDERVENLSENAEYLSLDPERLRAIVLDAGIVGLGGAQFPTHVKLAPPVEKKIEYVILNGAECEPYLTSDHRLMMEKTREIVEGLKILMRGTGAKKGIIGIETNKPDAIARMTETARENPDIEVVGLNIKYPQGAEKQLIKSLVNREVPSGKLPLDVGVVVNNVGTAFAVYNAVRFGRPLIERVVTVSGSGVKEPQNLLVRIGTPLEFLIQHCGGFVGEPEKIVMGGPMMGITQYTTKVPVIKGTSGILVFEKGSVRATSDYLACIRCGRCVDHCPMRISPHMYGLFFERNRPKEAGEWDLLDCMECGICAYVCPSDRPLVQFIKHLKSEEIKRRKGKAGLKTA